MTESNRGFIKAHPKNRMVIPRSSREKMTLYWSARRIATRQLHTKTTNIKTTTLMIMEHLRIIINMCHSTIRFNLSLISLRSNHWWMLRGQLEALHLLIMRWLRISSLNLRRVLLNSRKKYNRIEFQRTISFHKHKKAQEIHILRGIDQVWVQWAQETNFQRLRIFKEAQA